MWRRPVLAVRESVRRRAAGPGKVGNFKNASLAQVNDTLNSCAFDAASCISTSNDDKKHFTAPWSYDGDPVEAADRLVAVATGAWRTRLVPLTCLPNTVTDTVF